MNRRGDPPKISATHTVNRTLEGVLKRKISEVEEGLRKTFKTRVEVVEKPGSTLRDL